MSSTLVLLPAEAGDKQEWPSQFPASGDHFDKLLLKDNMTKYIYGSFSTGWVTDLFKFAPSIMGGQIASVTVNYTAGCPGSASPGVQFVPIMKTGGVEHYGDTTTLAYTNTLETDGSYIMTTNPETGSAWTWSEVYAMQAGVRCRDPGGHGYLAGWTYLDVTIVYDPDICSPNIDMMLL